MKHPILLAFFLFFIGQSFATDILIDGRDTFYLKTYPLEALHLKTHPFGLSLDDLQVIKDYPGYQAVWRIVKGKLYLENILTLDSERRSADISELFKSNNIQYQKKGDLFFAEWCSISFYYMEPYSAEKGATNFLVGSFDKSKNDNALVRVENGIVTSNKLNQNFR